MKKLTLFKVLVVFTLCVVGLGFYRGWFVLSSSGGGDGGNQVEVNLTVNPDKAEEDARELTGQTTEAASSSSTDNEANP